MEVIIKSVTKTNIVRLPVRTKKVNLIELLHGTTSYADIDNSHIVMYNYIA